MTELNDLLRTLHELNQWLVVAAGALALGIAIAAFFGSRPFGLVGRRTVSGFLLTIAMQIGLGVAIALTAGTGSEPFDGSTETLVWHALGGVLAIVFAGLAALLVRRRATERAASRTAMIWMALAVLSVGNTTIAIAGTVLVAVCWFAATRSRPSAPQPATDDHPSVVL